MMRRREAARPAPQPVILNRAFCGEESACLKARSRCFAPLSMTARHDAPRGPKTLHVAKCHILPFVKPCFPPYDDTKPLNRLNL